MKPRCQGCGKFVALGKGVATRVKRFDGREGQYFCQACTKDREGAPWGSMEKYCKPFGIPEKV